MDQDPELCAVRKEGGFVKKMIERIEIQAEPIETGGAHTSKGNQLKWQQEGWWYKADAFGYESLAEMAVSALLWHSDLSAEDIVSYEPVTIGYKGKDYRGCRSRNFRSAEEELIPLERLHRQYTGFGLAMTLGRIADVKERIRYTVELVENITGLSGFGKYLAQMLEMDAFFLNEDRHTNNIALFYNKKEGTYRTCPFFDFGLALFADTRQDYPLEWDFEKCHSQIQAKPFSVDFDEALDAANELYGSYLKFEFSGNRIVETLDEAAGFHREYDAAVPDRTDTWYEAYEIREIRRVEETLRYQAGKYRYMLLP